MRRAPPVWVVLCVGLLAVSTAAPLIRLAAAPALAVAAWRGMLTGAAYTAASGPALGTLGALGGRDRLRLVAGALLLAAHFALWISAFDHTSYAAAVLLLVSQPVFAAVLGRLVLHQPMTPRMLLGVGLALVGLALIVRRDLTGAAGAQDGHGLLGDGLALAGSLSIALYYVVVGPLRTRTAFAPYMAAVYGTAGIVLALLALAGGAAMTGYDGGTWAMVATLALVPTIVGHACFNWAIPRVKLFTLNMLIVLEPAIALALGALLLGERPTGEQMAGGSVLGVAVALSLRRPRREGARTVP